MPFRVAHTQGDEPFQLGESNDGAACVFHGGLAVDNVYLLAIIKGEREAAVCFDI